MNIPIEFEKKLSQDKGQLGVVYKTVNDFEKILSTNKLEFFPEYTDHGIEHIENVLLSIESLITEDSFKYLNITDISIIILSVLVHDIGMHITKSGFLKLLKGDYENVRINYFDKNSWAQDWEIYFNEARKFNQKTKIEIWGDKNINVQYPHFEDLNETDIKLIGEFIRRNHSRLAHEISLNGFPSTSNENIEFAHGFENNLLDIIGLTARSHGFSIRNTFGYLKKEFDRSWNNPFGSKIIYLMGLLRIADYIQINKERADSIILKTKIFSSPISKQEWEKVNSIKFINIKVDDPELIYVHSEPQNSTIYLELIKLFEDIQKEFDVSWAVIGEVYGRNEEFNKLKYKFRRIISNLDNKEEFLKHSTFIPEKIIFNSEPELLKLLIAPLYGKNPTYGVRELLQNAVDACLERKYLIFRKYGGKSEEYIKYKPEIFIEINKNDEGNYFFAITDNGIGMDKEILINYFFKAGASFINSEIWKKNFIEESDSRVRRSGRFGIGILASFLLGDELELETRYYDLDYSFKCIALIDSDQIETTKSNSNIGTKIKIILRNDIIDFILGGDKQNNNSKKEEKVDWFTWFRFSNPKITYSIDDKIKDQFIFLTENELIPECIEFDNRWRESKPIGYDKVLWTLNKTGYRFKEKRFINYFNSKNIDFFHNIKYLNLFCNGFCIPDGFNNHERFSNFDLLISVFDNNSKLPLTLDRHSLDGNYLPFLNHIYEEISKDFIAKLLSLEIKEPLFYSSYDDYKLKYYFNIDFKGELIFLDDGFLLRCDHILKHYKINKITYLWIKNDTNKINNFILNPNNIIFKSKYNSIRDFNHRVYNLTEDDNYEDVHHTLLPFRGTSVKRIILRMDRFNYLFGKNTKRASNYIKYSFNEEKKYNEWITLINKDLFNSTNLNDSSSITCEIDFTEIEKNKENIQMIIEGFYFDNYRQYSNKLSLLIEKDLKKYLSPDYLIPYRINDRKIKFKAAFIELEKYLKRYNI